MSDLNFKHPVYVFVGLDFIRQISSVAEASEFLTEWPTRRRGPIYEVAAKACEAARDGSMAPEQARRSVEGFLRITGMLAPSSDTPVSADIGRNGRVPTP